VVGAALSLLVLSVLPVLVRPVVVEEPPQYIERAPEPSAYWYYCPSAQAYYPQTATCQEPWIKVPPRQE